MKKLGLHFILVELGEVDIMENISAEERLLLKIALLNSGIKLKDDKRFVLIQKIKNVIIDMVHHTDRRAKKLTGCNHGGHCPKRSSRLKDPDTFSNISELLHLKGNIYLNVPVSLQLGDKGNVHPVIKNIEQFSTRDTCLEQYPQYHPPGKPLPRQ